MLFNELIGQHEAQSLLRGMVATDRMPHAILLLGPAGSGALPLALAMARYLLCEDRTPEDACGRCRACVKTAKYAHPDLHFSFPTIGSKVTADQFLPQWRTALSEAPYMEANDWLQRMGAENQQGNIPKEECLNIIRKFNLKTYEGACKVLVLWLPEYLGNEGNRLLKLIEEPPEQSIFLLVAENAELILNTILSRCQLVKLTPLSDEEVIQGLTQGGIDAETAAAAAHLAHGNFNDALHLATQQEGDHAALFLDWMRRCYGGRPTELVEWSEGFSQLGRENQKHFLRYALHFWREFLALKVGGDSATVRLRAAELETARKMQPVIGFDQLEQLVGLFNDCIQYVERNANPKILFLETSIRIHHILKRPEAKSNDAAATAARRA